MYSVCQLHRFQIRNVILTMAVVVKRGGVGYHLEYVERTPHKLVILEKVGWF